MNKIATRIVVLCALTSFAVFDLASTLSTCQQIEQEKAEQRSEKSCGFTQSLTYRGTEAVFEWIDRRHDFVTAAAAIVIAFFTFTLWRATDRLWEAGERQLKLIEMNAADQARDMKASISAATESAHIARRSLIASQRAWLRVVDIKSATGELTFNKNGAVFPITVKIRNVGNAPAIKVSINAWLVGISNMYLEHPLRCRVIREQPFAIGPTIFPGEEWPPIDVGGWSYGVGISREELNAIMPDVQSRIGRAVLGLVGCVDYTFPADADAHHQTGFVYFLFTESEFPILSDQPTTISIAARMAATGIVHDPAAD
jgi:hypothetical protein